MLKRGGFLYIEDTRNHLFSKLRSFSSIMLEFIFCKVLPTLVMKNPESQCTQQSVNIVVEMYKTDIEVSRVACSFKNFQKNN